MKQADLRNPLADLFKVRKAYVVVSLVATAILGYSAYALSSMELAKPVAIALRLTSFLLFYRAVSFIHEVAHLEREIPVLPAIYNWSVGYFFRIPAYAMETHRFHHARNTFGSGRDPEYLALRKMGSWILLRPFVVCWINPFFGLFRFVLVPLSWPLLPSRARAFVLTRLSSFVMNPAYTRPLRDENEAKRMVREDFACFAVQTAIVALVAARVLPDELFLHQYAALVGMAFLASWKSMLAHRYVYGEGREPIRHEDQILDSVTIEGFAVRLIAPLHLQYHSVHHWFPSLPFHSLPEAHRRLKQLLPSDHFYFRTVSPGLFSAIASFAKSLRPTYASRGHRIVASHRVGLVFMHLFAICAFFRAPTRAEILLALAAYGLRIFGITVGFHRLFTHRGFRTRPWVENGLAVLGSFAGQGPLIRWVSSHRLHHAFTEKEGDPHSPVLRGFWYAHLGWLLDAETFNRADANAHPERYSPGIRAIDRAYNWIFFSQIPILAVIMFGLSRFASANFPLDLPGFAWVFALPVVVGLHSTFAVSSVTHMWGYRNYASADSSRNHFLVAWMTLGEGWHNNHHAAPSSARLGHRWHEIDLGYLAIRCLGRVGLVWDVREKPDRVRSEDSPADSVPNRAKRGTLARGLVAGTRRSKKKDRSRLRKRA